jgi:hypothetical protein
MISIYSLKLANDQDKVLHIAKTNSAEGENIVGNCNNSTQQYPYVFMDQMTLSEIRYACAGLHDKKGYKICNKCITKIYDNI